MSADLIPEVSVAPVKRKAGRPKRQVQVRAAAPSVPVEAPVAVVEDEVQEPQRFATSREIAEAEKQIEAGADPEEVYALIVHDPFARKNPMEFKKHPKGQRLYWGNPTLRDRYGMRGLKFVKYDDAIGRNLGEFLVDAPSKMEGVSHTDNFVRRGDTILCTIPYGIWKYRQLMRDSKAREALREAAAHGQSTFKGEATSFGSGLRIDRNHKNAVLDDEAETANSITQRGFEMPREGEGR